MEEWPVKCQLDCDVTRYRTHLNDWIRSRREGTIECRVQENDSACTPALPPPTPIPTGCDSDGNPEYDSPHGIYTKAKARELGVHVVNWQRLPYEKAYPDRGGKPFETY